MRQNLEARLYAAAGRVQDLADLEFAVNLMESLAGPVVEQPKTTKPELKLIVGSGRRSTSFVRPLRNTG